MEENNKGLNKNKKQLITRVVAVIALILVITGVTYAAWRYTFAGTGTSTISTADLSLELLESNDNVINITNALPMDDTSGKSQTSYFDFVVTSKTVRDVDINYIVSIEELSVDSGYTSLTSNQIKLYLTDHNGTAVWTNATNNVQKVSDLTNYQLTTGTHEHDSTHNKVQDKYRLRVWIDSEVDASNWNSNTHYQYKFRLGVTGGEARQQSTRTLYARSSANIGYEIYENEDYSTDPSTLDGTCNVKLVVDSDNIVTDQSICYKVNGTNYCMSPSSERYDAYNPDVDDAKVTAIYQHDISLLNESLGTSCTTEDWSCHKEFEDENASTVNISVGGGGYSCSDNEGLTCSYINTDGDVSCYSS